MPEFWFKYSTTLKNIFILEESTDQYKTKIAASNAIEMFFMGTLEKLLNFILK